MNLFEYSLSFPFNENVIKLLCMNAVREKEKTNFCVKRNAPQREALNNTLIQITNCKRKKRNKILKSDFFLF